MIKRNVFIHIGIRKAGSTTIQRFISKSRDRLTARGFFLPPDSLGSNHLALVKEVIAEPLGTAPRWQDLVGSFQNSNSRALLVTSENFDALQAPHISRLRSLLASFDTRIIVYVRRQDLIIQSIWNERTRLGVNTLGFPRFRSLAIKSEKYRRRLDFNEFLKPWSSAFGFQNIILRPLERGQLVDHCLCKDFLRAIGVSDPAGFSPIPPKNASLSFKTLEVLRFARRLIGRELTAKVWRQVYGKPILAFSNLHGWNLEKRPFLSTGQSQMILEQFGQSNRSLARDYLDRTDGRLFVQMPEAATVDSFSLRELSGDEIGALSDHLRSTSPDADAEALQAGLLNKGTPSRTNRRLRP